MRFKFTLRVLLFTLALCSIPARPGEADSSPGLTIWLIPSEGPDESSPVVGSSVIEQIEVFNRKYGKERQVTVLNTTVPLLLDQLVAWNPDYAVPTWPIIKGQTQTLDAISRFAATHNVHINVRFVSWGKIFEDLNSARDGNASEQVYAPDVAQVGSTWIAYFAQNGLLLPQTEVSEGNMKWRSIPGVPQASLKLTTDVRLLFYWKRRLTDAPTVPPFTPNTTSWPLAITSIKDHLLSTRLVLSQPMVIPIGLSQNLLHDYIPLIWFAGGEFLKTGPERVDLTSATALAIPTLIAQNTVFRDAKQQSHRFIAFPEIGHDEAARYFITGDYLATLEPAAFVKRWYDQFARHTGTDPSSSLSTVDFWDYADAETPPVAFKGGSDLIVMRGARVPELASKLMRFLATDDAYTKTLSALGFLPAQRHDFGIDILMSTLGVQPETAKEHPGATKFANVLRRALSESREYPSSSSWPTELESREVLEAMQRLWRRIGESDESGMSLARIKAAAAEAELIINRRINWQTKMWENWKGALPFVLIAVVTLGGWVLVQRQRYRHRIERAEALDRVRKLRGLSSAAMLIVYEVHNITKNPYDLPTNKGFDEAKKALAMAAALQGWRRGRDERNWIDMPLETVVWRATILALESTLTAQLFKKWEEEGHPDVPLFLRNEELLKDRPVLKSVSFEVKCPASVVVSMPFMLEQALVCLLQNAIKASRARGNSLPITIAYEAGLDAVSIINQGDSLLQVNKALYAALSKSSDLDEFEQEIDALLRSDAPTKPGIGLIEAYSIATHCYGGLVVDSEQAKFSIRLHSVANRAVKN
jgi:ABC-type glycerol-3-phosphate transport system substrate-binding protein